MTAWRKEKLQENLEEWLENPAWRKYYEKAPSEQCREFIALEFLYSDEESDEIAAAMDEKEKELTIRDWQHLLKYCGNNPRKMFIQKKIKELEQNPPYRCCTYGLEAEQIYRNLQLQEIKSYGDGVTLKDWTVLHKAKYDETLFSETNERTLCRCCKCGALFLNDYHYESDMYDPWSSMSLYPVTSEEEADLINILMDGKETGLPDFRRIYRYDWDYEWLGTEDPRPLDTEELKEMIRKKYAAVNPKLLEDLIRKAGKKHLVEKTPMPEPEPEPEKDERETEKDYRYLADWDHDPPTLIRLGSFEKMEADMFVYPGVWKDTPYLNDIRVGLGDFMDYSDISEEKAMEIKHQLETEYARIEEEKHAIHVEHSQKVTDQGVVLIDTYTKDEPRPVFRDKEVEKLLTEMEEKEHMVIQKIDYCFFDYWGYPKYRTTAKKEDIQLVCDCPLESTATLRTRR